MLHTVTRACVALFVSAFGALLGFQGQAQATPVREVPKLCGYYEPSFRPLPGTDICMEPYVGAGGAWGTSTNNFAVTPDFDVTANGGLWYLKLGTQIAIPGTVVSVGPSVSYHVGYMKGSITAPPASPLFTYSAQIKSITALDVNFEIPLSAFSGRKELPRSTSSFLSLEELTARLAIGIASVKTNVTGTSGAFSVTDSQTNTGWTGLVGISKHIPNTDIRFDGSVRWIHYDNSSFIPGQVLMRHELYIVSTGLVWDLK